METALAILGVAVIVLLLGIAVWLIRQRSQVPAAVAKQLFEKQFEQLQASFFQAASSTGKPRGLIWKSCNFGEGVAFARDKATGELLALVPVTIAFEAVAGGDMEGLPAVGNLRCATAVFAFRDREWTTTGRAAFNMDPAETLNHFRHQYEPIAVT